jgi:hypothetical protein
MNIYIFGNGNLSFDHFIEYYEKPLRSYLSRKDVSFLVCDFKGVDTLVMELLKCTSSQVTLYHIGERPRYLPDKYRTKVSQWQLKGGFESDEARDLAAIDHCTHYLAVDFNSNAQRKSGTQANIELCQERKKSRIEYNQNEG